MKSKLYDELKNLLLSIKEFTTNEGTLNFPQIQEQAFEGTQLMISTLLSNETIKNKFFIQNGDTLIYNRDLFLDFISNKNFLANSYTKFSNKIGLSVGNKFFKQNSEVVLNFPFKDCVLEGGQTKDDKKQSELFFNEILAQDEIDKLFDPKIFTNAKKINKQGENPLDEFTRDEKGTIKDNLLIKGNNLIALHTIKKQFRGKIKLIYIDPPYNTGNDSFNYNDNFNHSTWLTFMKNRLEVARDLLRDDGVIFVQCDDNEQAYLKVLMDEVFGRENFVCNIVRECKAGGGHDSQYLSTEYDYILFYSISKEKLSVNKKFVDVENDSKYSNVDKFIDKRGKYYLRDLDFKGNYSPSGDFPIKLPSGKEIYPGGKLGEPNTLRWSKEKIKWGIENEFIVFDDFKKKIYIKQYQFVDNEDKIRQREIPYKSILKSLNTEGSKEINNLFDDKKIFIYPKPEGLIKYILDISTKEGDIVLDYHIGSGTTGAVAHKMGRQWIGIEQMDYIEDITKERLKKVIDGEQGGISKSVDWKGGGEFVYMELKENTAEIINKITNAQTKDELLKIKESIKDYTFIDYKVDLQLLKNKDPDFESLSLEEQQKILVSIFDKNQMYISYSERNDELFNVSEEEKRLSEEFYEK